MALRGPHGIGAAVVRAFSDARENAINGKEPSVWRSLACVLGVGASRGTLCGCKDPMRSGWSKPHIGQRLGIC